MTITAIAKQLNVSTMTVYRRLKQSGVNIDDLRDASTGTLTTSGVHVMASLFDSTNATPGATGDTTLSQQPVTDGATGATPGIEGGDAVTIAVLRAKLDAANDTIARLESERDRLIQLLDAATMALEREQSDRQSERLLLTTGVPTVPIDGDGQQGARRGWWARMFGRK